MRDVRHIFRSLNEKMGKEGKEEKGVFLVQREGRITIPSDMRKKLGAYPGSYVAGTFRMATDSELLGALRKHD